MTEPELRAACARVGVTVEPEELARRHAERIEAEIRADLEASNACTAKHGSFAEMVREHYSRDDE